MDNKNIRNLLDAYERAKQEHMIAILSGKMDAKMIETHKEAIRFIDLWINALTQKLITIH